uniref:Uncharacterized protein n=1 Tax=Triticum urartu TaxID=4572 RepID=A0A8R7UH05_TRIUA
MRPYLTDVCLAAQRAFTLSSFYRLCVPCRGAHGCRRSTVAERILSASPCPAWRSG